MVLYTVTLALFATGAAWAWLYHFAKVEGEVGLEIHPAEPWMLKAHGAAAMGILVLLGTLLPIHVQRGWQSRRNRKNGGGLLTAFGILTLTGYGLYCAGGGKIARMDEPDSPLAGARIADHHRPARLARAPQPPRTPR